MQHLKSIRLMEGRINELEAQVSGRPPVSGDDSEPVENDKAAQMDRECQVGSSRQTVDVKVFEELQRQIESQGEEFAKQTELQRMRHLETVASCEKEIETLRKSTLDADIRAHEYQVNMVISRKEKERAVAALDNAQQESGQMVGATAWLRSELDTKVREIDKLNTKLEMGSAPERTPAVAITGGGHVESEQWQAKVDAVREACSMELQRLQGLLDLSKTEVPAC